MQASNDSSNATPNYLAAASNNPETDLFNQMGLEEAYGDSGSDMSASSASLSAGTRNNNRDSIPAIPSFNNSSQGGDSIPTIQWANPNNHADTSDYIASIPSFSNGTQNDLMFYVLSMNRRPAIVPLFRNE